MNHAQIFDGPDYIPDRDNGRLLTQMESIRNFMLQNIGYWSLRELEGHTGHPQASISAQLRHLRKPKHGGFIVEKKYRGDGLFVYRLGKPAEIQCELFKGK